MAGQTPTWGASDVKQPASLAEAAFVRIRDRLRAGSFAPDQRLTEQGLARMLAMSRTPVHEALERLVLAGLLEPAPNGGYLPRRLTLREIRELYELRLLLEPQAAAGLAGSQPPPLEAARLEALAEHGIEFDAAVSRLCGNRTLASLIGWVHERFANHPDGHWDGPDGAGRHRQLLAAVAEGDGSAAERAAVEHLTAAQDAAIAAWRHGGGPARPGPRR